MQIKAMILLCLYNGVLHNNENMKIYKLQDYITWMNLKSTILKEAKYLQNTKYMDSHYVMSQTMLFGDAGLNGQSIRKSEEVFTMKNQNKSSRDIWQLSSGKDGRGPWHAFWDLTGF